MDEVSVSVSGPTGQEFYLQFTDSLVKPSWVNVATSTIPPEGSIRLTNYFGEGVKEGYLRAKKITNSVPMSRSLSKETSDVNELPVKTSLVSPEKYAFVKKIPLNKKRNRVVRKVRR